MAALLFELPADAAVWADETWPVQTELLAQVAEGINDLGRLTALLHGVKARHLPEPLQIQRPWVGQKQLRRLDLDEIQAFFSI